MKIFTKLLDIVKIAFLALTCLFVNICNAQTDYYNLIYPVDEFTEDAVLDLSYLNDDVAGENGFIQLSDDGEDFVNGIGENIRLWAIGGGGLVSADAFRPLSDEQVT